MLLFFEKYATIINTLLFNQVLFEDKTSVSLIFRRIHTLKNDQNNAANNADDQDLTPGEEQASFQEQASLQEQEPAQEQKAVQEPAPKKKSLVLRIILHVLLGITVLLSAALFFGSAWYKATFNISFSDLLFTILSPLGGTGASTVSDILWAVLPPVIIAFALFVAASIALWPRTRRRILIKRISAITCIVALPLSVVYALFAFRIPTYLINSMSTSELYENEYVDPADVKITDKDGNARNLIYIYLESMEVTYASEEAGGKQETDNYMPHMTEMAKEYLSFSDTTSLGGFKSVEGTSWTMGALLGTTSGVPFSLAVFGEKAHNSLGKDGTFLNPVVTLGDILKEKGYTQEFLCGSNASFGGRRTYFTVHGDYKIFDLYTAREKGYIAEDYHNGFWGFEDEILFEIAKDEITALAAGDQPFNFTMLTVDAHHVKGYKCNICGNEYDSKTANVIACQDSQVYNFIEWCKQQDFFENTTIIITGDHPRMDKHLIPGDLDNYDRPIYNCIINAAVEPYAAPTNRTFTSLDMFPTTLAAIGFEIDGERLGLGTNLFSPVPTLCEKHGGGREGFEWFNGEISKRSDFYEEQFVGIKK